MNDIATLKNRAISALLAGVIAGAAAGIAHAETGSAPSGPGEKQTQEGWSKEEGKSGGWLSRIFGSSDPAPAADKAGSTPGWSSPRDSYGSCKHSSDGEEDLMCKLVRIFWGPDRPNGPNRDMDDNIASGGAGG